jgi:hypothetical protein
MHFGENQLSPGSIGISPLPTAHPSRFQPTPVRAFTKLYLGFTLAMGRSPGFGSATYDLGSSKRVQALFWNLRPIWTRFRFGSGAKPLNLSAAKDNSPVHSAKGTRSPIYRLPLLVGVRFQVLFHSPSGVLFTVPSRYCPLSVAKSV